VITAVLIAARLWLVASRNRVRRISRREVLDAADINRMVVALNRSQTLNARAARMTGASALLAAARVSADALVLLLT
jgi:hypothetical protein